MSRYTVICHRCGKSTFVDLSKTISDQRCRACRGFLQGVDVSIGDKPEVRKKLVWHTPGAAGREPEWRDQETQVIPVRQRWPRFYRWIVFGGLVAFLGAVAYAAVLKSRRKSPRIQHHVGQEESAAVDVRLTEAWRLRATALAHKALAAKTVDELLPLLFHPEVNDDVIRQHYQTQEELPLGTDLIEEYFIPPGEHKENVVAFSFTDLRSRPRAFVVVEKPDGMLIDWPSLVGLGEMSVQDYISSKPEEVVVLRARARIGHYYNNYFNDSSKWLSIRLSDVTDEHVIHGYVDRSLPVASVMESTFADTESKVKKPDEPVIVIIKHPAENSHSDQTQIIGLAAMTWYHPDGLKALIERARLEDAPPSVDPAEDGKKPKTPEQPPGAASEGPPSQ